MSDIILPWQCRKREDSKFLKRDMCDKKRALSLHELNESFVDGQSCFKCEGPLAVDTNIKVEEKKSNVLAETIMISQEESHCIPEKINNTVDRTKYFKEYNIKNKDKINARRKASREETKQKESELKKCSLCAIQEEYVNILVKSFGFLICDVCAIKIYRAVYERGYAPRQFKEQKKIYRVTIK